MLSAIVPAKHSEKTCGRGILRVNPLTNEFGGLLLPSLLLDFNVNHGPSTGVTSSPYRQMLPTRDRRHRGNKYGSGLVAYRSMGFTGFTCVYPPKNLDNVITHFEADHYVDKCRMNNPGPYYVFSLRGHLHL